MSDKKTKNGKVTKESLKAIISAQIKSAESEDSEHAKKRATALEYIQGDMKDLQAEKGRSSVTSRDVADTISWMLPSIMRVFITSDDFARAEPVSPSDEQFAESATNGLNHLFLKENDGYKILYDATYDALSMSNAIVKVWYDETPSYETAFYDGLDDNALQVLMADDEVEVLAQTTTEKTEIIDGQEVVYPCHEVKIRREKEKGQIRIECVPREDYGQDGNAKSPADSTFQFHKSEKTRSELVEMGFDRKDVDRLAKERDEGFEGISRDTGSGEDFETTDGSTEVVDLFECYFKMDVDDDGIAESVRAYYAGNSGGGVVLDWEVWEDEDVFFDIPCNPIPHRFEGEGIFDVTRDIQEVKTVLTRQALDNLYSSNIPQRQAEADSVINPDELMSPEFGGVIYRKKGSAPIETMEMANVAGEAFGAMDYFDQVTQRRTGVGRQTMALNADALNNQTATASNNEKDAGYTQVEQVARNMAELGWKKVFKAMLRLMVKHQDKAKQIRVQDKWVDIDPRYWNADMQVTINVGLGTGTRERDMMMLAGVFDKQVMLAAQLKEVGLQEKALEMVPMIFKTAQKLAESSGLRSPEQYIPEFNEEDQQKAVMQLAEAKKQPSPEQQKMQAEMQMKEKEMQMQVEMKKVDAQVQSNKERAQAEADILVDEKRRESDMIIAQQRIEYERERDANQLAVKLQEIESKNAIEMLKIGSKNQGTQV